MRVCYCGLIVGLVKGPGLHSDQFDRPKARFFLVTCNLVYIAAGIWQVVKGATAQAMMNRAAALVKWEGIMDEKTRVKVLGGVLCALCTELVWIGIFIYADERSQ